MSRKSIETLINAAREANDVNTLKSLYKEKQRRRDAKNKSRRKSYRLKKKRIEKEIKKQLKKEKRRVEIKKDRKSVFHIILLNHGRRLNDLFQTPNEKEANVEFRRLLEDNKNVDFPVRYNTSWKGLEESEYELVIIKKSNGTESSGKIRDAFGNYIEYETNNDNWVVYDRATFDKEESFWVYGYNPTMQRKSYKWVFDNLISRNNNIKQYVKFIYVFYNKFIVDCNGSFDMVICKTPSDAVRMYNYINRDVEKNKYKNIMFMGKIEDGAHKRSWVNRISMETGWNRKKVLRKSTQEKKLGN